MQKMNSTMLKARYKKNKNDIGVFDNTTESLNGDTDQMDLQQVMLQQKIEKSKKLRSNSNFEMQKMS